MTNKQRKTAIEWLQEEIRSLRLAPKINGCGPENWADLLDIMETCLEAVRGHGYEPLTLEQLREMDGQPVWVEFEDKSGGLWGIVHISVFEQIVFPDGLHCSIGYPFYGKTYKAYACSPARIDREAWAPCEYCRDGHLENVAVKPCGNGQMNIRVEVGRINRDEKTGAVIFAGYKAAGYVDFDFCPFCGKPQTPKAWAELDKRLRG